MGVAAVFPVTNPRTSSSRRTLNTQREPEGLAKDEEIESFADPRSFADPVSVEHYPAGSPSRSLSGVRRRAAIKRSRFETRGLAAGVYLVRLRSDGLDASRRRIITR